MVRPPISQLIPNPATFWRYVDSSAGPDECWPWTGARQASGYGRLRRGPLGDRHSLIAHRVAYELTHGDGSAEGLLVLHACDRPWCCNPAHLMAGTHVDNMRAAAARGRLLPRGSLPSFVPVAIRRGAAQRLGAGISEHAVTAWAVTHFDVNYRTAERIIRGDTYPDAPGPVFPDFALRRAAA